VPSAVKVFNWITTIWRGNLRLNPAMLFAIGFVSMFISGGLTGIFLGNSAIDIPLHDTYFVVAHFHIVMGVAAFFGMFAGVYHWFPKMFGRHLNDTMGYIHFYGTLIGAYAIFFPMHFMTGIPRRYARFDSFEFANNFGGLNKFISIMAMIVFVLQLMFVINVVYSSLRGRRMKSINPYGATTLEWTTPVEHFHGNWSGELPEVHRWPYDYAVNGQEFIPQTTPLSEGEISHS